MSGATSPVDAPMTDAPMTKDTAITKTFNGPIIWDLDGTIMDSLPGILNSIAHSLRSLGLAVPEELRHWAGPPFPHSLRTELGLDETQVEQAVAAYREYYVTTGSFLSTPFDGVIDIVRRGQTAGRVQATATSKPISQAIDMLKRHDIFHAFSALGAASDDEKRSAKYDVLDDALTALHDHGFSTEDAVMVGDRIHDFEAAAEHGLPSIAATWGYGTESEWAQATLRAESPAHLSELLALPIAVRRG